MLVSFFIIIVYWNSHDVDDYSQDEACMFLILQKKHVLLIKVFEFPMLRPIHLSFGSHLSQAASLLRDVAGLRNEIPFLERSGR